MTQKHECIRSAQEYLRRIKNKAKREYAGAYFRHLTDPKRDGACEPHRGELSVMGAQAVRIELARILKPLLDTVSTGDRG